MTERLNPWFDDASAPHPAFAGGGDKAKRTAPAVNRPALTDAEIRDRLAARLMSATGPGSAEKRARAAEINSGEPLTDEEKAWIERETHTATPEDRAEEKRDRERDRGGKRDAGWGGDQFAAWKKRGGSAPPFSNPLDRGF